jgi:glycolate oxidase
LSCHIIGAGSQTSVVASLSSMVGNNIMAISHSYSARNLLGVEWVLPTGEILRLGTAGTGSDWFSGDGPGPSLRGIMRGASGAMGGLGVFTRCAIHLHPWPGPAELEVNEISPDYEAVLPPLFEYHICQFPTWEQYGEAVYKIGSAGIGFALHKTGGPGSHGSCVTVNNNEYYEKRQKGELAIPWCSFTIVQAANTEEEHSYQVKTLDKILLETGGSISEIGEEPVFKKRDFLTMIKSCFIPRLAFRPSGTFGVDGIVGMESMDHCAMMLKMDVDHRNKYAQKGVIVDDGTLNSWGVAYEGTHFALSECGHQFNALDNDSIKGMMEMVMEGTEICVKTPIAFSWTSMGPLTNMIGPLCCNHQNWMRKIKKTFDPGTISDPFFYISAEEK